MHTNDILKADVLDIIFDKRNKDYGAYTLRKFYSNRLYKSIALTGVFAAFMLAFTYLPKKQSASFPIVPDSTMTVKIAEIPKDIPLQPKKPELPKPLVKQQVLPKPSQTAEFLNKLIITKDPLANTKITNITDSTEISSITNIIPGGGPKAVIAPKPFLTPGGTGIGEGAKINRETPLAVAEIMPEYPGGMAALRKFLEKNLQNPQDLDEGSIVSVKIKFVVGYDGALKSFETVEDGGRIFNNEVLRVLKKMPPWIAGKSGGENVSVFYTIPVKFTPAQ